MACLSDDVTHFVGKLTPGTRTIKGIHGSRTTSIMSGTIRWNIPGSFYLPEGKCCLLSLQHWAQSQIKTSGMRAWEITDDKSCALYWDNGNKCLSIPLGNHDNVATFWLSPGYSKFTTFYVEAGIDNNHDYNPIIAQEATAISDDEDDGDGDDDFTDDNWKPLVPKREQLGHPVNSPLQRLLNRARNRL
jgi:hypothetical protein